MYILIDKDNKIIGTTNHALDSNYLKTVGLKMFRIAPDDFDIEMIGKVLHNFEVDDE